MRRPHPRFATPRVLLFALAALSAGLAACGGGCGGEGSRSNQAPEAVFTADPTTGPAPLTVRFDASASSDPDGTVASYAWEFGDGATAEGPVAVHTYVLSGTYSAVLTVTDDRGATASETAAIAVALGAPSLAPVPPATAAAAVTLLGRVEPGAAVVVRSGGSTWSAAPETDGGAFRLEVPLAVGENQIQVRAVRGAAESEPVALTVSRAAASTLALDRVEPATVRAGDAVTLTGSGFRPERTASAVLFEREGSDPVPGVVLEAAEDRLVVAVPPLFLEDPTPVRVWVADVDGNVSGEIQITVTPARDPTPDQPGNETAAVLEGLRAQAAAARSAAEAVLAPRIPREQWERVAENFRRIDAFLGGMAADVTGPARAGRAVEDPSSLDAVFAGAAFQRVRELLQEVQDRLDALGRRTPRALPDAGGAYCDVAEVVRIVDQIRGILDDADDVLLGLEIGSGICCFVGVVPCCVALAAIETARQILGGIIDALGAVRDVLYATVPTEPSNWSLVLESPYKGVGSAFLYTDVTGVLSLRADFASRGVRDVGSRISGIAGWILDLLDIDIPSYSVSAVTVPSAVARRDPSNTLLTVRNEGAAAETHYLDAGPLPGLVDLDVQASCGPYRYPDRTECLRPDGDACLEWDEDRYPRYHTLELLDAPVIESADNWYLDNGVWIVEGKGFSTNGPTFRVDWNRQALNMPPCETTPTTFEWCNVDKPGWLRVGVYDEVEGERWSNEVLVCPPLDTTPVLLPLSPDAYPGDPLYVIGNRFTPFPEDNRILFLDADGPGGGAHPTQLWVENYTLLDLAEVPVPEDLAGYAGHPFTLTGELRGVSCPRSPDPEPAPFDVLRPAAVDRLDQTFVAYAGPRGMVRAAAVGDFDGDGIADLAVGVPEDAWNFGRPAGAVYIVFGPLDGVTLRRGVLSTALVDLADEGVWDVRITGDTEAVAGGNSRRIGNALLAADLDGDGRDDLVIGSTDQALSGAHLPEFPTGGGDPAHVPGAAYVFYGRARTAWNAAYDLTSGGYDARLAGDDAREVGYALAGGDMDGDGRADLVVTAPTDPVDPDEPNGVVARAYVVFGTGYRLSGEVSLPEAAGVVIEGENAFQRTVTDYATGTTATYKGDGLGKAVAVGDLDGDGVDDLVLGAPDHARVPGGSELSVRHGAVHVFYGGGGLTGTLYAGFLPASDRDLAIEGPRVFAGGTPTGFGRAVTVVDLDGDGRGDLAVGAPFADLDMDVAVSALLAPSLQPGVRIQEPGVGRVYLVDGERFGETGDTAIDGLADAVIHGSVTTGGFGYALAAGDVDGDGLDDLLVGAPAVGDSSGKPGRVWGLHGGTAFWWNTDATDELFLQTRRWLAGGPDPDPGWPLSDAVDDFLYVGAPRETGRHTPGFGAFVAAVPLVRSAGLAVLVADPQAGGPANPSADDTEPRERSGAIYAFFGSPEEAPWPLAVSPAVATIARCDDETVLSVYGGRDTYAFSWSGCYLTWTDGAPGQVLCAPGLPEGFAVESGLHDLRVSLSGCVPDGLVAVRLEVSDGEATASARIDVLLPDVDVSPSSLAFEIQPGWSVTNTVLVSNGGDADLSIAGVTLSGSDHFYLWDPEDACAGTLAPGGSCTVGVGFSRPDEGVSEATLTIATDDPDEPVVEVPLTGTATISQEPDISVIGLNPVFTDVPVGSTRTQEITIKNEGPVDLHVTDVTVSGDAAFTLATNGCTDPVPPFTGGMSQMCTITVAFTPTGTEPVYGEIRIASDDPDEPVVTGNLSGYGISPFLYVSPTFLDLGEETAEAAFALENMSPTESLDWSVTGALPSWLSVSPSGGTLGPGGRADVTVTVDRTGLSPGSYGHDLALTSDGGDETVTVQMNVPVPPEPLAAFAKAYGGASDDELSSIRSTPDGGFIAAGRTKSFGAGNTDAWVVKLDASGDVEWAKAYGGTDDDRAYAAVPTSDGGYAVVGGTWSWHAPGDDWYGLWVFKLDASGEIVWQQVYGGHPDDDDDHWEILETADGGLLLAGMNSVADDQAWILRLDAQGDVSWQRTVGGSGNEAFYSVDATADGGWIAAGITTSAGQGLTDALVARLDASGGVMWQKAYGGDDLDYAFAVRAVPSGGYAVAGLTYSFGPGSENIWVARLDEEGTVMWQKAYGLPGAFAEANGLAALDDGGFIVSGWLDDGQNGGDAWLLRLDAGGAVVWSRTYGGSGYERAWSVVAAGDDFAAVGLAASLGAGYWDAWILKVDAVGNVGTSCGFAHYADVPAADTSAVVTQAALPVQDTVHTSSETLGAGADTAEATTTAACTETETEAALRVPVDVDVSPGEWDAGYVLVGQMTAHETFTVRNTGYEDLDLYGIALDPALPDFGVVDDCPAVLPPTHRCDVTVGFTPTQEGTQATDLVIESADPESPVRVPVSGVGFTGKEGDGGVVEITVPGG